MQQSITLFLSLKYRAKYDLFVVVNLGSSSCEQLDTNDSDTLIDLLDAFYQLVEVILRSCSSLGPTRPHHIFNQPHVRLKFVSMLKTYFTRLVDHFGQNNIMSNTSPMPPPPAPAPVILTPTTLTQTITLTPSAPNTLLATLSSVPTTTTNSSPDTDDDGIFSSSSCGSSRRPPASSSSDSGVLVAPLSDTTTTVIVSSPQLGGAASHYHSIDDYIYYRSKLIDYKLKIERLETILDDQQPRSLKQIARDRVNWLISMSNKTTNGCCNNLSSSSGLIHRSASASSWPSSLTSLQPLQSTLPPPSPSLSALSKQFVYFKLPANHLKLVNSLTENLIDDLYGHGCDLEKLLLLKRT